MQNQQLQPNYSVKATEYCSFLYGQDDFEVTIQLTQLPNNWMVSQKVVLNGKLHEHNIKVDKSESEMTTLFLDCVRLTNEIAFESFGIAQ